MDQKEKDRIFNNVRDYIACGGCLTLNGEPANIHGRKLDFPVIVTVDNGMRAEFSWQTVERVYIAGGDFEV